MEAVDIPNKGELYVWVKNKDKSEGKVVLRTTGLYGAVIPMVITDYTVEGYIESLSDNSDFFLFREGVEAWGYDLREFTAYTMEEKKKYVWYTPNGRVLYRGTYEVGMRMVDARFNIRDLVGGSEYMLSEAEVESSLYDKRKFLGMGSEGMLLEGYELGGWNLPSAGISSAKIEVPKYGLSEAFLELHKTTSINIRFNGKEQADILAGLIQVDSGYSEMAAHNELFVYENWSGADFLHNSSHVIPYQTMAFEEAVVKLKSPFS